MLLGEWDTFGSSAALPGAMTVGSEADLNGGHIFGRLPTKQCTYLILADAKVCEL